MQALTFWCLALLGLAPLLGLGALGFWEVLRLAGVVLGLAWLLWRHRRGQRLPWGELLVSLVFMFTLTQFAQDNGQGWVLLGYLLLIVPALIGVRRELWTWSRLDGWVLGVGGVALGASVVTQLTFGPESGQLYSERWWGPLYLLELLLVYLAASRLVRGSGGAIPEFRLLAVACGALLLPAAVGIWQIAAAQYHAGQARSDFAAGQYERAAAHVAALRPQDQGLEFGPLAVEHAVGQLAATAKGADAWMALGDIAAQQQLWSPAQDAYRRVYQHDPQHPAVCARLGRALLEDAKVEEALATLRQGATQPGAGLEEHLALAVALVRTGAWTEANQALDAAFATGGLEAGFAGNQLDTTLGDLLPPLVLRHARQATLFGVASLLERRGWLVLHPATEVGRTGVRAPVDIAVYSGGDYSARQEQILVAGRGVSRRIRGYNFALVAPQSGKVDTVVWFDQSNTAAVANFLREVPEGHIVALSANEDIAMSATPEVWEEIRRLGGALGVGLGWSYALVGVRGANRGEGVERRADRSLVVAGVLSANIPEAVVDDPVALDTALREAAAKAPAGIAVYLPSLESEARLIAVRR
jgi:tetratricopeptide (TPR) repeat protein